MAVTVSGEFPLFVIAIVAVALDPTVTLPKTRLPVIPMIFVADCVTCVEGTLGDPPQAETQTMRMSAERQRFTSPPVDELSRTVNIAHLWAEWKSLCRATTEGRYIHLGSSL